MPFEPYLVNTPHNLLGYVIKFRTRNNRLLVETGSWNRTELHQRKCTLCNCIGSIGDEFHYLLECKEFSALRKRHLNHQYIRPNSMLFKSVKMNIDTKHYDKCKQFCLFVKEIIIKFDFR
jgi:hypothetical protein